MNIIFSMHAKKRCKEQNINMDKLRRELKKLPSLTGKVRWLTKDMNVVILEAKSQDIAIVITVIPGRRFKEAPKGYKT